MNMRERLYCYPYIAGEIERLNADMVQSLRMKKDVQDTRKAQVLSDMPRNPMVGDPTLQAVIKSIDRHDTHITYLSNRISALYDEWETIDNAMIGLSPVELQAVTDYFFNELPETVVAQRMHYSVSFMWQILEKAVKKITQRAEAGKGGT